MQVSMHIWFYYRKFLAKMQVFYIYRNIKKKIYCIPRKKTYNPFIKVVPVAQSDRVLASDAKGCEFEPRRARHDFHYRLNLLTK